MLEMGPWIYCNEKPELEPEFLAVCDEILRSDKYSQYVKDGIFVSIVFLDSERGITYILDSDCLDDEDKQSAVRSYNELLIKMIQEDVTPEKLRTVLSAAKVYPAPRLSEPLEKLYDSFPSGMSA